MHSDFDKNTFSNEPFCILINLDHEKFNRGGTHWVGLFKQSIKSPIIYYDSFGLPPSDNIINSMPKGNKIIYNNSQHQQDDSNSCGLFVLRTLKLAMEDKIKPEIIFSKYYDNYPSDKNESNVRKLLRGQS